MDHYESMVIILNSQLGSKPASFTWKRSRTAFFALPLSETDWKWIVLSHCNLTSRSCLKDAPRSSWMQPNLCLTCSQGWRTHWVFVVVVSGSLLYRGVAIEVVLLLVHQLTKKNEMFTEMQWQHLFQVQKVPDKNPSAVFTRTYSNRWWYPSSKEKIKLCKNKAPFVGSLFS